MGQAVCRLSTGQGEQEWVGGIGNGGFSQPGPFLKDSKTATRSQDGGRQGCSELSAGVKNNENCSRAVNLSNNFADIGINKVISVTYVKLEGCLAQFNRLDASLEVRLSVQRPSAPEGDGV